MKKTYILLSIIVLLCLQTTAVAVWDDSCLQKDIMSETTGMPNRYYQWFYPLQEDFTGVRIHYNPDNAGINVEFYLGTLSIFEQGGHIIATSSGVINEDGMVFAEFDKTLDTDRKYCIMWSGETPTTQLWRSTEKICEYAGTYTTEGTSYLHEFNWAVEYKYGDDVSEITCYQCQGVTPVGRVFSGDICPEGWFETQPPCTVEETPGFELLTLTLALVVAFILLRKRN